MTTRTLENFKDMLDNMDANSDEYKAGVGQAIHMVMVGYAYDLPTTTILEIVPAIAGNMPENSDTRRGIMRAVEFLEILREEFPGDADVSDISAHMIVLIEEYNQKQITKVVMELYPDATQ